MPLSKALLLAHTEEAGGWTDPNASYLRALFTLDTAGSPQSDESGYGNDMTLNGDAYVDSSGLHVDGDDYGNCGKDSSLYIDANEDFSVCLYYTEDTRKTYGRIIGRDTNASVRKWALVSHSGYLRFMGLSGAGSWDIAAASQISLSTEYHIALTVDRDGNATIYKDGTSIKTSSFSGHSAYNLTDSSYDFLVARRSDGYGVDGTIRAVRYYLGICLSQSEVEDIKDNT